MELIVITSEKILNGECEALNMLLEAGLKKLHIRKPESEESDMKNLLSGIRKEFLPGIVLHDHFKLIKQFNIGGVHINRRNPSVPSFRKPFTVSRSCHTIDEVAKYRDKFDYLFLSPVFDSISKKGYLQGFTEKEIREAKIKKVIDRKIIALGGITPEKIPLVGSMGFGGVAILGGIWQGYPENTDEKEIMKRYINYQNICDQL